MTESDEPAREQYAPTSPGMSRVIHRNIRTLTQMREKQEARQSLSER